MFNQDIAIETGDLHSESGRIAPAGTLNFKRKPADATDHASRCVHAKVNAKPVCNV